jgi:bifunctional DNA-binding transcriptional regulator/antitoxin component of YhaV-PrlF toxin-antitoxin module
MARGYARLRERNQLTLPSAVVEQIGLRNGDIIEFATSGEGFVEMRPARIVRAGTPEAWQEVQAAKQQIADGNYTVISNMNEFRKHVERLRKGEHKPAEIQKNQDVPKTEHLTDSQRRDVEAVVQATFLKLLTDLMEQSTIRKHEEGSAERRKLRSKAGESV